MHAKVFRILVMVIVLSMIVAPASARTTPSNTYSSAQAPSLVEITDDLEADAAPKASHRLIVEFESPPLAAWAKETAGSQPGSPRLELSSSAAQTYLNQIQSEQAAFVSAMQNAVAGATVATYINEAGANVELTYQVVFNGLVVDPGQMDSKQARLALSALPGVKAVYPDKAYDPQLYASLPLINAPALWEQVGGQENAGRGVKVASMDGGLHHDAPMFSGEGFSYPPGFPIQGLGFTANNNGKIVASRVYFRAWDPPAPGDENPWPGENGTPHGNHTAGIAAGNPVVADYLGITETISGVAPAAWLMSYRVFYNSVTGDGSFYAAEGIKALEDIVNDGADVLNNSWGGGPGSVGGVFDPIDNALINAANAGIFISMSAGNAGPGRGTGDHPSQEYISVAATTTEGTLAAGRLSVSAPEPVPDTLQNVPFTASGVLPAPGGVYSFTFAAAAVIDPANEEGCSPWPDGTFTGLAAVVSRGSCNFSVKVDNAQKAGAAMIVVYNHAAGGDTLVNMDVGPDPKIPALFVYHSVGLAMVDWYDMHGAASELTFDFTAYQAGNDPDIVANFSSRGPGVGNVAKPDIAAPGVNILSQGYDPAATGEDRHLGFGQVSGTSMAAPHVAGAAAIIRQIHPSWPNHYIKSALMSTSKFLGVYNEDGTHAQPLDMGAGRLDLTNAADPGVIITPPGFDFGLLTEGETSTISVTLTSVALSTETYDLSTWLIEGAAFTYTLTADLPGFSLTDETVTLAPGESVALELSLDTTITGTVIGDNQGYLVLESENYHAHMPIWARISPVASADILLIDNDASSSLGFPDYSGYYMDALDNLGLTYDYHDADANFNNPTTIPEAAVLSSYGAVIYFTGDNFYPNGTFTVATALTNLDMNALTEYANDGGILIAMGQDLAAVLNSDSPNSTFFYNTVLGGNFLQDSVTGFGPPVLPVVALHDVPPAFDDIVVDLGMTGMSNSVELLPENEVPPVPDMDTTGMAHLTFYPASNELSYFITVETTSIVTLTAAHIHPGAPGENGPPIHPLPFDAPQVVTDTFSFDGVVTLTEDEVDDMFAGELYINIHSTDYPAGHIRGQVEAATSGDGAGNQFYIDEIADDPFNAPEDPNDPDRKAMDKNYIPLLRYPGPFNEEAGIVTMAHRDQPTLEIPGVTFNGRTIYATFGLEGVNNGTGATSREELLTKFLTWALDEPEAEIMDITIEGNASQLSIFEATVTSNWSDAVTISGTMPITETGILYRWDFGDETGYIGPFSSPTASHTYEQCGLHTVRVEATDMYGNRAVAELEVDVTECLANEEYTYVNYLPLMTKHTEAPPEE